MQAIKWACAVMFDIGKNCETSVQEAYDASKRLNRQNGDRENFEPIGERVLCKSWRSLIDPREEAK